MTETAKSELEQRLEKIGTYTAPKSQVMSETLRSQRSATTTARPTRASAAPSAAQNQGELAYDKFAELTLALNRFNRQHGKYNAEFADLIKNRNDFGLMQRIRMQYNRMVGDIDTAEKIEFAGYKKSGESLNLAVENIARTVTDARQTAIDAQAEVRANKIAAVNFKHKLERSLVDKLSTGYVSDAEMAEAELEASKFVQELTYFEETLTLLHSEIEKAKTAGNAQAVKDYALKAKDVLTKKYGVIDGKIAADGEVSELRRKLLSNAHSIDTIKGSIVAADVNMATAEGYVTQFGKLVDMYSDIQEYVIDNMKISAQNAKVGRLADSLASGVEAIAEGANGMLTANLMLLGHVEKKVREVFEKPIYDVEEGLRIRQELYDLTIEVAEKDMAYVNAKRSLEEVNRIHSQGGSYQSN